MHIATLGDVMLDVIVDAPDGLREDDDVEAQIEISAGGQAANVAAWAAALGARATLIGPRGQTPSALLVDDQLAAAGVGVVAIDASTTGTVVSIIVAGARTLASDPGDQGWTERIDPMRVPLDVDWLHVSGYPLLRSTNPRPLLDFVDVVRRRGSAISLDLSSAELITAYGASALRDVLKDLAPNLVFGNEAEWDAFGLESLDGAPDMVIKRGGRGVTCVLDGVVMKHSAVLTDVVDLTGAGDALAAGYLVGGIEHGLLAAARCVARRGAQPTHHPTRLGRHRPTS